MLKNGDSASAATYLIRSLDHKCLMTKIGDREIPSCGVLIATGAALYSLRRGIYSSLLIEILK